MKIIAGSCHGMRLEFPKGQITRPTSARVREAVMNMLAPYLLGAVFIDLFAGSGAMACEALSRGAEGAVMVERDRKALLALRKNVGECRKRCQNDGRELKPLKILSSEVEQAMEGLRKSLSADIVWADPPYREAVNWLKSSQGVALNDLVAPGGLFLMEAGRHDADGLAFPDSVAEFWELQKIRGYGESAIVIWKKLDQKG